MREINSAVISLSCKDLGSRSFRVNIWIVLDTRAWGNYRWNIRFDLPSVLSWGQQASGRKRPLHSQARRDVSGRIAMVVRVGARGVRVGSSDGWMGERGGHSQCDVRRWSETFTVHNPLSALDQYVQQHLFWEHPSMGPRSAKQP